MSTALSVVLIGAAPLPAYGDGVRGTVSVALYFDDVRAVSNVADG